jgi:hypothetical protein
MPMPSEQSFADAQSARADAVRNYRQTNADYKAVMDAQKSETEIAAQQYEELAKRMLPQVQQSQPAPNRGLQPFLASTKEEDPYTTISKAIQAVSLFATMVGGGRNGARASISAMTGALEGWREGSRHKADAAYQTWKAETENMLKQFDDEMRRYNSLMIAERVPLDQKLRAMEITAREHQNAMASAAFEVGEADRAVKFLEDARKSAVDVQLRIAQIDALKNYRDQQYEAMQQRIQQGNDKLSQQLAAQAAGQNLRWEIEKLRNETRLKGLEDKANKPKLRPLSTQDDKIIDNAIDIESSFDQMDKLLATGRVDLNKIMGGINPWLTRLSQRWGGNTPVPPEGTKADPMDRKLIKGRLTPEEQQFLSVMENYGSLVILQRSGTAASGAELDKYLRFGLDSSLSPETNRSRMLVLRSQNIDALKNRLLRMRASKKDAPDINELIPRLGTEAPSGVPAAQASQSTEPGKGWGKAELVK